MSGNFTPKKHSHLWNELPRDERQRLAPYLIESHILHLEQTKADIVSNHKRLIADINSHIKNLKSSLAKTTGEQA